MPSLERPIGHLYRDGVFMAKSVTEGLFGKKINRPTASEADGAAAPADPSSAPASPAPPPAERRDEDDRRAVERRETNQPVIQERRARPERRKRPARRTQKMASAERVVIAPRQWETEETIGEFKAGIRTTLPEEYRPMIRKMHDAVLAVIDIRALMVMPPDWQRRDLTDVIQTVLDESTTMIPGIYRDKMVQILVSEFLGMGPLDPLLEDPKITDVMVNGPNSVWVEREGKLLKSDVTFDNAGHLQNMINRIVLRANRHVDETTPMVDTRLTDGSRVNVIVPPVALRAPAISIRKFVNRSIDLDGLIALGAMSADMALMLKIIARYRLNVLISGGTGTGKTTMLGAICRHVAAGERIITIEDTAELQLQKPNLVELESRPPNIEGEGEVTIHDLVVNALRMRPDRIIIGEVRGSEAAEMLQAMNTGHDGSIGTVHANNARDALARFENMICMSDKYKPGVITRQQVVSALDVVVHLSRMQDGSRRITDIVEVTDLDGEMIVTRPIFSLRFLEENPDGTIIARFQPSGQRLKFLEKIKFYNMSAEEKALLAKFKG
ncbi:MAG: CpaF family protein [Magnetospiraceae bacterium]